LAQALAGQGENRIGKGWGGRGQARLADTAKTG
jgi:hypothetical protein